MKPCLHLYACELGMCCKIGVAPMKCPWGDFQRKMSYQNNAAVAVYVQDVLPVHTVTTVAPGVESRILAQMAVTGGCNCGKRQMIFGTTVSPLPTKRHIATFVIAKAVISIWGTNRNNDGFVACGQTSGCRGCLAVSHRK
jgi:hypothetical protein